MTDKRPKVQIRHIQLVFPLWQKIVLGIFVLMALVSMLCQGMQFFGFLSVQEFMEWAQPQPPAPDETPEVPPVVNKAPKGHK